MKRRKKGKNNFLDMEEYVQNLPTKERINKGGIRICNNIGMQDNPLRIDKLMRNGIIDEMQHLYGMQIITCWMIANRAFIRAASYEMRIGKIMPNLDFINLSRMSAEDKFHKTMALLNERERALISKICFDEMGAIEAGRSIGLPVNNITVYVRAAFDALGNALSEIRRQKREMEKVSEKE